MDFRVGAHMRKQPEGPSMPGLVQWRYVYCAGRHREHADDVEVKTARALKPVVDRL